MGTYKPVAGEKCRAALRISSSTRTAFHLRETGHLIIANQLKGYEEPLFADDADVEDFGRDG